MVGNSIRDNVEHVLKLGVAALQIPANTTWEHENLPNFNTSQNGFCTLEHLGQLVEWISKNSDAV